MSLASGIGRHKRRPDDFRQVGMASGTGVHWQVGFLGRRRRRRRRPTCAILKAVFGYLGESWAGLRVRGAPNGS